MTRGRAMSKARRAKRSGVALLETVIALGVLAIGTAAVMLLVTQVSQASVQSTFHTASLSLFSAFSAQVRAATCDVAPSLTGFQSATSDPGLAPGGPYAAPVSGQSAIQLVGGFDDVTRPIIQGAPPMRLTYVVVNRTPGAPYAGPPVLEVQVEIREIKRNATLDAAASGYWIRSFSVQKICAQRTDSAPAAGCPAPCGRGEFY